MSTEFPEKRHSVRVPLSLPIFGKIEKGFFRSHDFEGKTEDASYEGLCINVPEPNGLGRGDRMRFKTQLYRGDYLLEATGVVRWVAPQNTPEGPIRMGVELTEVGHLRHWIERIEEKIVSSVTT